MKVQTTRAFDRDYAGLPETVKARVDKQLPVLLADPRHPSLHLKKIRGAEDIWEARITRGYRLTLNIAGDTIILRRVGTHDILREG